MEKQILGVATNMRADFYELNKYGIRDTLSDKGQLVWDTIHDFYNADDDCQVIDKVIIKETLGRKYPKHKQEFSDVIDELPVTSGLNLKKEVLEQKKEYVKQKLSQAFSVGQESKIETLLEEYERLVAGKIEILNESEILIAPDIGAMMELRDASNRIAFLPPRLTTALEGGPLRGHHVVVFSVTDMGKTLFTLNLVRGFIESGLRVLYVGNEDPVSDLIERFLVSLSGKDKWAIRKHWKKAQEFATKKGWGNLVWAEMSPGTLGEIRGLIESHTPDVLVVDQIRNLDTGDKNFVRVLEVAAQGMRNFAKKYNLLSISVTQAGDSANNKVILNRGDIDNSNVGIPGTTDLMIGIGATHQQEIEGVRTLSFPKNKVSGNKRPLQVFFNTTSMRVE